MTENVNSGYHYFYETDVQAIRAKAVVVVGDAAGIGREVVALLANEGARVFYAADNLAQLQGVRASAGHGAKNIRGVRANLSDPDAVREFFEKAHHWLGQVDAVVSLVDVGPGDAEDRDMRQALCTQEAIHQMLHSTCGHIVHITPGRAKYGGVKEYLSERSIAPELRRRARELGIRVTLIEPSSEAVGVLSASDVARCVFNSLAQPFSVDLILMQGQFA